MFCLLGSQNAEDTGEKSRKLKLLAARSGKKKGKKQGRQGLARARRELEEKLEEKLVADRAEGVGEITLLAVHLTKRFQFIKLINNFHNMILQAN